MFDVVGRHPALAVVRSGDSSPHNRGRSRCNMTNLQTIERRSLLGAIYQRRRVAAVTRLTLQNERWRTANETRLPRSSSFSFDIHTNVYARESLEAVPRFMHSDWSGNRL